MPLRDIIVTAIVFGSLPFILMRPYIGIYMWAWISYMNPHRLAWGFAYEFPFAQLIAMVLFVAIFVSKRRESIPMTGVTFVWLSLIFWMCVSTVFALNPDIATTEWLRTMKIQLLALLTVVLIFDKKVIQGFVWVVTLSIVFFGVKGGVFILTRGGTGKVYGPPDSFFEDNNALAVTLLMVLPLLVILIQTVKEKVRLGAFSINPNLVRLALWSAAGLSMISVLFTHSRGALLTVIAMTGLAILKLKGKQKALLVTAILISIPVVVANMPDEWFARMQTIETFEEDTSAMGRINAWYFAFHLANDRPLVGGGFDTFTHELFRVFAPNPEHFQDSHSIYFEMLAEHGYVGLIFFLLLGLMSYRMAGRAGRNLPESEAWVGQMGAAVQFGIAAYAVGGAFLGLAYFDLFYHLVGLALILYRHADNIRVEIAHSEVKSVSENSTAKVAKACRN